MKEYISKEKNSFIHNKTDEEYVIEQIRQKMYEILSKSSLSDFSRNLEELLRSQSCIDSLQATSNKNEISI